MKHAAAWLVALALSVPFVSAGETQMTKSETEVMNLIETMTHAFQAGKIDQVMSTYEANATVMFEPGVATRDRSALEAAFTQFATVSPVFSYSGHEVIVEGDIAVHFAPWNMTGTAPDGTNVEANGLSVAVARKQKDGSWKMVIDNPYGGNLLNQ